MKEREKGKKWNGARKRERERESGVCLAKQGQPLVRCPSFIDKGPGKYVGGERGEKKKLMKLSTLLN